MVVNGKRLFEVEPIKAMARAKLPAPGGTSYGLGEAGYDIRIKQDIEFFADHRFGQPCRRVRVAVAGTPHNEFHNGRFVLASTIEEFDMPSSLVGIVHDKSTWARRGLSVFNTVIEPGWKGFLTMELVYHGEEDLLIPAGSGIAQVMFHSLTDPAEYDGKYQNQADEPVPARNTEVM